MKRENWICLLAFLCGVIIVNLFGNTIWINNSLLNKYNLATLSFREIVYEEYLVQILWLRFQTVMGLWLISKVLPKRLVFIGFLVVVSAMLGAVTAMAIMANGVWGVLFCLSAVLPHGIFYGAAYVLWGNIKTSFVQEGKRKENYFVTALILVLTLLGCICEAYVCPILIENVIKF